MRVEKIVVGPFQVNCYIVYCEGGGAAAVIDPGDDAEEILRSIARLGLRVTHIINTHGHADHMAANGALRDAFPEALIMIHGRDAHMLSDPAANLSVAFGYQATSPAADRLLEGNTAFEAAGVTFRVEHIAGHSPGSVCLIPEVEPPAVFGGDTLFSGTVGRTDFPGGNMGLLVSGIREKILSMPDETVVYPGHGEITTVGAEKRDNVYVMERDGEVT